MHEICRQHKVNVSTSNTETRCAATEARLHVRWKPGSRLSKESNGLTRRCPLTLYFSWTSFLRSSHETEYTAVSSAESQVTRRRANFQAWPAQTSVDQGGGAASRARRERWINEPRLPGRWVSQAAGTPDRARRAAAIARCDRRADIATLLYTNSKTKLMNEGGTARRKREITDQVTKSF